jgi:peptide-methionine (S)-S-oxide reductase
MMKLSRTLSFSVILGRATAVLVALGIGAASPAPALAAHTETAVLAGGCFWGLEAVFERLKGVSSVVAGFSGGDPSTAHYDQVSTGSTGHAESVEIRYDPTQISYATLLKVYFTIATDPTELNRQGPDEGTQYRSEIFYLTREQKATAESTIAALTAAHTFSSPIVTKVEPMRGFYRAEDYHQHFYDRNPTYPYIVYNDKPKVEALESKFPQLVRAQN